MCQQSLFIFLLIFIFNCCESATKSIVISRCCHHGESAEIVANDLICVPNPNEKWKPVVYSKRKKSFLGLPSTWNITEANRPFCGSFNASLIKHDFLLIESGLLYYNGVKISRDKFCVENNAALLCLDDLIRPNDHFNVAGGQLSADSSSLGQHILVRKCCGQGGVYSMAKSGCTIYNETENIDIETISANVTVTMIAGFPACPNDTVGFVEAGQVDTFNLMDDGRLQLKSTGMMTINPGLFCVEFFLNADNSTVPHVLACHDGVVRIADDTIDWRLKLYAIGLIISVIFLIATLATGFLLPSSHHVLHWRCQTNYVLCLLIGDFCLAVSKLAGHKITGAFCIGIASVMHFFFLAAFFWLNTMCFNIWWTFRDLRPASLEKGQEACRLRLYEIYAWGLPLIISGIGAIVDNLPQDPGYEFLRPRFAERVCWFYGDMEIFTYFFGPIGILLTINLILFGLTARELTCGLWKREVVKSNTERAALGRVCLKLVVVMGVSWAADVLSWAAGGPQELWYVTDIINTLQGLFIFIVIGCQPQVWAAIKRMWCLRKSHVSGTTANGNHHSSSSHALPSLGDSVTNHTLTNTTNISCKSTIPLETSC